MLQEGMVTYIQFSWLPQVYIPLEGKTLETEVKGDDVPGGQMTMILEAENTTRTESPQNHTPTPTQPSPHRVRPRRKAPPPPQKVETTAHVMPPHTLCVCCCSLYLCVLCRRRANPTLLFHPHNSPLPLHTPRSHPPPPHTLRRHSLMPNFLCPQSSQHMSPLNHPHLPSSQHTSPLHKPHLLPWAEHIHPQVRVDGNQLLSTGRSVVPLPVG